MPYLRAAHADADYEEGLPAHMVSHHSNSDGISPSLTLMSPSNFHKMHTFLRVTNTCHCLVMMTYTNIHRTAFLCHYFFHTKLIPKPPGLLLCSLHHHYIRPPASAAPLARKLPAMCLAPRRPPEKETLVWRLLAFVPPFSGIIYIYILCYINLSLHIRQDASGVKVLSAFTACSLDIVRPFVCEKFCLRGFRRSGHRCCAHGFAHIDTAASQAKFTLSLTD